MKLPIRKGKHLEKAPVGYPTLGKGESGKEEGAKNVVWSARNLQGKKRRGGLNTSQSRDFVSSSPVGTSARNFPGGNREEDEGGKWGKGKRNGTGKDDPSRGGFYV